MPNVAQYTAQGEITPSDKGIEAELLVGRRAGQLGNEIGSSIRGIGELVEEHEANLEVSNAASTGSVMEQNFLQGWADVTADPKNKGNPDLAQTYLQQHVEPIIQEWQSHLKTTRGREFALAMADRMRERLTSRLYGDQSNLDAQHAHDNIRVSVGSDAAASAQDPSQADDRVRESDLKIEAMGGAIRDVSQRAQFVTTQQEEARRDIYFSAYNGMAAAARTQVSETGDPTKSPALAKLQQWVAEQHGFASLSQEQRDAIIGVGGEPGFVERATRGGQEAFKLAGEVGKAQLETEGKSAFAQLNTQISDTIVAGGTVGPDVLKQRDALIAKYGGILPGEVSATNTLIREATRAQVTHDYVPSDPHVQAGIVGRLSIPPGQPGYVSPAELASLAGHGLSIEDVKFDNEFRDRAAQDPGFKTAFEQLKAWQARNVRLIERGGDPNGLIRRGGIAAANIYINDSTATFNGWYASERDGGKAYDIMTNASNPRHFQIDRYALAARQPDPQAWLNRLPGYEDYARAQGRVAAGSIASPIEGPTPAASAAAARTPPPGPLSSKDSADMARIAGGH